MYASSVGIVAKVVNYENIDDLVTGIMQFPFFFN